MSRRSLLLLAGALAVVAGAAALAVRRGARPTEERRLWPGGDPAKVERLEISGASGKVVLAREDGEWQMTEPLAFPASGNAVQPLLDKLPKATLAGPLTQAQAKLPLFGLGDGEALRLVVSGSVPLELKAGKAGPDYDGTYVLLGSGPAVFEARGLSRYDLAKSSAEWVSKQILRVPPEALEAVVLKSSFTVSLLRSSAGWSLEGKGVAVSTASGSPLNNLQGALNDLQADSVLLPPLPALTGKPRLEVRVRWSEKGARQEAVLSAYPERDGMTPLVKQGEDRVRFLVYGWRLDAFKKPASEFP